MTYTLCTLCFVTYQLRSSSEETRLVAPRKRLSLIFEGIHSTTALLSIVVVAVCNTLLVVSHE